MQREEETGETFGPKQGAVVKRGPLELGTWISWVPHVAVLASDGTLSLWKTEEDRQNEGKPALMVDVSSGTSGLGFYQKDPFAFQLSVATATRKNKTETHLFKAANFQERELWMQALVGVGAVAPAIAPEVATNSEGLFRQLCQVLPSPSTDETLFFEGGCNALGGDINAPEGQSVQGTFYLSTNFAFFCYESNKSPVTCTIPLATMSQVEGFYAARPYFFNKTSAPTIEKASTKPNNLFCLTANIDCSKSAKEDQTLVYTFFMFKDDPTFSRIFGLLVSKLQRRTMEVELQQKLASIARPKRSNAGQASSSNALVPATQQTQVQQTKTTTTVAVKKDTKPLATTTTTTTTTITGTGALATAARWGLTTQRVLTGLKTSAEIISGVSAQYAAWNVIRKEEKVCKDVDFLQHATFCAQLCSLIYEPPFLEEDISKYSLMNRTLDIQGKSGVTQDWPFWALVTDKQDGHVFLIFRGTDNAVDSLIDTSAQLCEVKLNKAAFRAHAGCYYTLMQKYQKIMRLLQRHVLTKYKEDPSSSPRVTITGHSLGGGYAILFYLLLHCDGALEGCPVNMDAVTFGAPAVMAPLANHDDFVSSLQSPSLCIHNFVHAFDIVPRCLGNGVGIKFLGTLGDVVLLRDYVQLAHLFQVLKETEFVQNTMLYRPYGQFYFLSLMNGQPALFQAENDEDKGTILTLPVVMGAGFRPTKLLQDHFITSYVSLLFDLAAHLL